MTFCLQRARTRSARRYARLAGPALENVLIFLPPKEVEEEKELVEEEEVG